MKKIIIRVIIFTFLFVLVLSGCGKKDSNNQPNSNLPVSNQPSEEELMTNAKQQIINFKNYQHQGNEINKIKRGEDDILFYYAANGKRYVFPEKPDQPVFRSWFNNFDINNIEITDKDTLYLTDLAGNVTIRPGYLVQTETVFETYISTGNGQLRALSEDMIKELYGDNWQAEVITIPNFYFSQYNIGKPITNYADFPQIPGLMTIDKDKGL